MNDVVPAVRKIRFGYIGLASQARFWRISLSQIAEIPRILHASTSADESLQTGDNKLGILARKSKVLRAGAAPSRIAAASASNPGLPMKFIDKSSVLTR